MTMSGSLADEMPKQQARVRELLVAYKEIGPNGAFGAMMLERALKEADEASISGDLPRMIRAFENLKSCE
jgi:hypothetical protein